MQNPLDKIRPNPYILSIEISKVLYLKLKQDDIYIIKIYSS